MRLASRRLITFRVLSEWGLIMYGFKEKKRQTEADMETSGLGNVSAYVK